ncbi:Dimethylsulfonioproprionate lyase DddP [Geodia barretti]|uniref:Dimethylsulfonioproprionate lyase DddP n=1 Tax=Geodia barretti TaxID=519541 RepID=A0AA35WX39_GEOBA|nr:Dimethylsulfonioproprionate lyase DddP [Geodia barretti]
MEHTIPPCDLDEVRRYRLARVREALAARDLAGIILYDPVNIRYATDASNMQVWCAHNEARYLYVPTEGPVTLFEFGGGSDLINAGLPTIDEVRGATYVLYFIAGGRQADNARAWAAELDSVIRERGGGNPRIAIDRVGPVGMIEMQRLGYEIHDGFEVMENARKIKSDGEIILMRHAIAVCEQAIVGMREALRPGITENALWAELHRGNIAGGGEWIECRLLASGPRTNPWFRESSMRVIERGDIVAFDTDLVGPYGYCADISRTWVCDARPSDEQRRIYAEAYTHILHDKALLKPGVTFREVTEGLRPLGDEFVDGRYSVAMHGVGLCDEYPAIPYPQDYEPGDDGVLQEGMVMCVEALAAPAGGREAVKLEEQVLITADGYEQLSSYPLEEDWL